MSILVKTGSTTTTVTNVLTNLSVARTYDLSGSLEGLKYTGFVSETYHDTTYDNATNTYTVPYTTYSSSTSYIVHNSSGWYMDKGNYNVTDVVYNGSHVYENMHMILRYNPVHIDAGILSYNRAAFGALLVSGPVDHNITITMYQHGGIKVGANPLYSDYYSNIDTNTISSGSVFTWDYNGAEFIPAVPEGDHYIELTVTDTYSGRCFNNRFYGTSTKGSYQYDVYMTL